MSGPAAFSPKATGEKFGEALRKPGKLKSSTCSVYKQHFFSTADYADMQQLSHLSLLSFITIFRCCCLTLMTELQCDIRHLHLSHVLCMSCPKMTSGICQKKYFCCIWTGVNDFLGIFKNRLMDDISSFWARKNTTGGTNTTSEFFKDIWCCNKTKYLQTWEHKTWLKQKNKHN